MESAEVETQTLRGKLDAVIAAHQAERSTLDERHQSAESRWLTEVDRVRQHAKEQDQHIKDFKREVTQLKSERDTLRQEMQGARADLKTAAAVREQFEMRFARRERGSSATTGRPKAEEVRFDTNPETRPFPETQERVRRSTRCLVDTIDETVALIRRQCELELDLMNRADSSPKAERDLLAMRQRLAAHPYAVVAILHTARALRRSPDAVSARDVAAWSSAEY